ncbi:putative protein P31 [Pistachio ampelovirus A]|uniref:Cation efflux protein transmembrane domain-containing protein n=1 Tax=Pistachio ampelovirus A TaxID=2093224 RepID=A0A499PIY2_9CLOS|nr:putative protein P31 [Pistachio ampelovirus A]AVN99313.1 putative protein P31 [Pistachio ampelovirus A]
MALTPDRARINDRRGNSVSPLIVITNVINLLILVLKVYISIASGSKTVLVTAYDSLIDLMSGGISYALITRYVYNNHRRKTLILGTGPVHALNSICSSIMFIVGCVFFLFLSLQSIVYKTGLDGLTSKDKVWIISLIGTLAIVVVKLSLYLAMCTSRLEDVRLMAQDHLVDVFVNSSCVVVIASYGEISRILDGVVASIMAIAVMLLWIITLFKNLNKIIVASEILESSDTLEVRKIEYEGYNVIVNSQPGQYDSSTGNIILERVTLDGSFTFGVANTR